MPCTREEEMNSRKEIHTKPYVHTIRREMGAKVYDSGKLTCVCMKTVYRITQFFIDLLLLSKFHRLMYFDYNCKCFLQGEYVPPSTVSQIPVEITRYLESSFEYRHTKPFP